MQWTMQTRQNMLNKTNLIDYTNIYKKAKLSSDFKQYWSYMYTTIMRLADHVKSNFPCLANNFFAFISMHIIESVLEKGLL
jgi:hypothetical protein